jgi:RNA polymerase sigma factor (sigma-70 family)
MVGRFIKAPFCLCDELASRDIVFPIEVLYACKISEVDFLKWVRDFIAKRVGEKVSAEIVEEVEIPSGKRIYPILWLKGEISEAEMDELELELTTRIFGFFTRLTEREKEILRKRVAGSSLYQIADELGVKPQTVVTILKSVRLKVAEWFTP